MDSAFEAVKAFPVRKVAFSSEPDSTDKCGCTDHSSVVTSYDPFVRRRVESGCFNLGVENGVLLDVDLLVDVCEVLSKLV